MVAKEPQREGCANIYMPRWRGRTTDRFRQEVKMGFCRSSYQINTTHATVSYNQHVLHLFEIKHIHILM